MSSKMDEGYEPSFLKRLGKLELSSFIASYDFLIGLSSIFIVYLTTNGSITENIGSELAFVFVTVSGTLFAIVLTGLTIITSFTDKQFLYAWHEVGEFENLITYFQFNLFLPIIIIFSSIVLIIRYHPISMILLIGLFIYFLASLLHLLALICHYALQRGEFVREQVESELESHPERRLSNHELKQINEILHEKAEKKNERGTSDN